MIVQAGGKDLEVQGGLTAPRLIDWNGDGLTDIVCGGFEGGVFLFVNDGKKDAPRFAAAKTLIAPDSSKVFTSESELRPTSGCYVDAVDYDMDGDLDLLVGGYAQYQPKAAELSEEQQAQLADIRKELSAARQEINASYIKFLKESKDKNLTPEETQEEVQKLLKSEAIQQLFKKEEQLKP